jgi:hypothetical protein
LHLVPRALKTASMVHCAFATNGGWRKVGPFSVFILRSTTSALLLHSA